MGSCFHIIDYLEEREIPAFIALLGTYLHINLQLSWVYASLRVRHSGFS